MDSSPQHAGTYVSLWEANQPSLESAKSWPNLSLGHLKQATEALLATRLGPVVSRAAVRMGPPNRLALKVRSKALAALRNSHPALVEQTRRLLPFLPPVEVPEAPEEPDVVELVLSDYENLDRTRQDKVAKNLVLLWDNFQGVFGGMSGFLAAPQMDQEAFMEKLNAAADRMASARGTEAAFHYVTVELMRQYISFFQVGRSDRKAVALATCVAALIDRGRGMDAEPAVYPIKS